MSRLATPNWQLEWNLPRWLAEAFALPEEVVRRVVLANVLGLGYVRMIDDLRDRETASLGLADTRSLANVLYEAAISTYLEMLGTHEWFWAQLERFLHEWQAVKPEDVCLDVLHAGGADVQSLARLGSPLHIGTAAMCAISGQEGRLEEMMEPVRHYLVACVLLDHMQDWREDTQAGRPNLFVRALLDGQPSDEQSPAITVRVCEAFLRSQPVQDYLDLAGNHFHVALSLSRRQRLHRLADYLETRRQTARRTAEDLARRIDYLRGQAAGILFEPLDD
ncbi:MAG TPA: hypothetical protein VFI11_02295 [Anaerolineales bacterium]|nr:hypothetical protein [Anaerolineales bacterium]